MRKLIWIGILLATAAPLLPAAAQETPNQPIQNRPRPDYDPLGIRAGAFLIYPSVATGVAYDDNVFADPDDEEDDIIFNVAPRVEAQSQWSRHELEVGVGAEAGIYLDQNDSNYFDYGIDAAGRLDVRRNSRLNTSLELAKTHEDRESPDDVSDEEGDITDFLYGELGTNYRHSFNRFFVQPGVNVRRYDFDDVGDINNDDRDRNRYQGILRLGVAVSPRIAVFGQGDYRIVRYDETPDDGGVDRDAEGYGFRVGTEIDITDILFGEVSVGYTTQDYDDSTLEDAEGIAAGGALTWNVTPLTSIIGAINAEVNETTVVVDGEPASSAFETSVALEVDHELRRNVLVSGLASYSRNDFEGTSRTDDTFVVGAGLSYLINRMFSLEADYRFSTRQSDDNDAEYDRNIVRIGLTARL